MDLGVDVVELMPVAAFDGRWGWGYDGVDLYAVHEPYGGPAALQRFVDACHRRGLAACLDVVYNHLGPSGSYVGEFGPYFTNKHTTPWGDAVNLDDEGCEHVRRWIVDNALRWFAEFHVDALRLDAVHALLDHSPRHLLAQLSDETAALSAQLGRPLSLVAESDLNDPRMIEPTAEGGLGHDRAVERRPAPRAAQLAHRRDPGRTTSTSAPSRSSPARSPRSSGTPATTPRSGAGRGAGRSTRPGTGATASSDTCRTTTRSATAPRATGSAPRSSPGRQAVGAALYMASAFTPMIFMGEEWAASTPWQFFTDFPDPGLGAAIRDGRRSEFAEYGWNADEIPDPQDSATRDASVLDWAEPAKQPHARVLAWYRALTALRRREPDLRADDLRDVRVETGPDRLTMRRGGVDVHVNIGLARCAVLRAGRRRRAAGLGAHGHRGRRSRRPAGRRRHRPLDARLETRLSHVSTLLSRALCFAQLALLAQPVLL